MERKRDGLVPIREAFGGLDGGGLIPIGDALSGNAYSDRTIWWIRKRPVPGRQAEVCPIGGELKGGF